MFMYMSVWGKYLSSMVILQKKSILFRKRQYTPWYRYVINFFGLRRIEKKIKLSVLTTSENSSNILAPILGQYGIKPSDFLSKLRECFIIKAKQMKTSNIELEIENMLKSLPLSFNMVIKKNNVYDIYLKKPETYNLFNAFFPRKKGIPFNALFFYKLVLISLIVLKQRIKNIFRKNHSTLKIFLKIRGIVLKFLVIMLYIILLCLGFFGFGKKEKKQSPLIIDEIDQMARFGKQDEEGVVFSNFDEKLNAVKHMKAFRYWDPNPKYFSFDRYYNWRKKKYIDYLIYDPTEPKVIIGPVIPIEKLKEDFTIVPQVPFRPLHTQDRSKWELVYEKKTGPEIAGVKTIHKIPWGDDDPRFDLLFTYNENFEMLAIGYERYHGARNSKMHFAHVNWFHDKVCDVYYDATWNGAFYIPKLNIYINDRYADLVHVSNILNHIMHWKHRPFFPEGYVLYNARRDPRLFTKEEYKALEEEMQMVKGAKRGEVKKEIIDITSPEAKIVPDEDLDPTVRFLKLWTLENRMWLAVSIYSLVFVISLTNFIFNPKYAELRALLKKEPLFFVKLWYKNNWVMLYWKYLAIKDMFDYIVTFPTKLYALSNQFYNKIKNMK